MGPSVDQRLLKNKISEPKDLAIETFQRAISREKKWNRISKNYGTITKKSTTYDNVIPPAEQGVNK